MAAAPKSLKRDGPYIIIIIIIIIINNNNNKRNNNINVNVKVNINIMVDEPSNHGCVLVQDVVISDIFIMVAILPSC